MESQYDQSLFQKKYDEFVEDLIGALPEYTVVIQNAKALSYNDRINRFQSEVKSMSIASDTKIKVNPGAVLPGVIIEESVWATLSETTQNAICEYVQILSVCCFMEAGFGNEKKPEWMDEAMEDMKKKLDGVDFEGLFKKFSTFFTNKSGGIPENGEGAFPKIPEKFLKGHLAKLAQELVADIKPEDIGISQELLEKCEKSPAQAFNILLNVFTNNPGIIQSTVQRIGKRLQQKIQTGVIRPQEIAREAEELMKEFTGNKSFVDMMDNLKSVFGFEDMGLAKSAGKEGSARLALVRQRLQKKLDKKKQDGKK